MIVDKGFCLVISTLITLSLPPSRYNSWLSYCRSKLANVMFARELSKRVSADSSITVCSLHPGTVYTELTRHTFSGLLIILKVSALPLLQTSQITPSIIKAQLPTIPVLPSPPPIFPGFCYCPDTIPEIICGTNRHGLSILKSWQQCCI